MMSHFSENCQVQIGTLYKAGETLHHHKPKLKLADKF
jgi:hypothetical protein